MPTFDSLWSTIVSAPLTSVLLTVLVLVILMLLVLTVVVMQLSARLRYLSTSVYDYKLKEAQEKADEIVAHARETADKVFTERKNLDETFRVEQSRHIQEVSEHAKELLERQEKLIAQHSAQMADVFTKQAEVAQQALTREVESMQSMFTEEDGRLKQTFADLSAKAAGAYESLIAETRTRLATELSSEIDAARSAIAQYRQERMRLVERDIVTLVEDTARIALGKALSLQEHRDVVLAALTEAKQQGVFTDAV